LDKNTAMIRCPSCGAHIRQDRLSKNIRKAHSGDGLSHPPQGDGIPDSLTRSRAKRGSLAEMTDKALKRWLTEINKELKGLAVGFSRERIEQLTKEKRMIAAEFRRRKASLTQTRWTRWSKGPGSVRRVTGNRSIWARKEDAEQRKKDKQ
jgi:hypothetical protein